MDFRGLERMQYRKILKNDPNLKAQMAVHFAWGTPVWVRAFDSWSGE